MSEVRTAVHNIIQDAIYDARNDGKTIGVAAERAAESVLDYLANELTKAQYGDAFRGAWLAADAEGRTGERVEAGLTAVAKAVSA